MQSSGQKEEKELTWKEKLVMCLKCKRKSADDLLGEGLAKRVGNVTECALLGFLVELGKWVWWVGVVSWGFNSIVDFLSKW